MGVHVLPGEGNSITKDEFRNGWQNLFGSYDGKLEFYKFGIVTYF